MGTDPTDPTQRALRLLALLQSGARLPGPQLAARLGVSARTLRRDADRLRRLGYTVHTRPGRGGSYQLAAGTAIPPLLLDADEITVVIAGLRLIAPRLSDDETAQRVLAKLGQLLPPRLARRLRATDLATEILAEPAAPVGAAELGLIADAVAEQGRIRFAYRNQHGRPSQRLVDPHRHVLSGAYWYLVGYDIDRADWRTFRLDRVGSVERLPGVVTPRDFPDSSVGRWFATDFGRLAEPRERS